MNYRYSLLTLGLLTALPAYAVETDIVERVKDIVPGMEFFRSDDFTNVNGTLYFKSDTPMEGRELWKSDGTPTGTIMVKDINPMGDGLGEDPDDTAPPPPPAITNVNGTIFFVANDGVNGFELWKSDGTEAGTVMVKDINPAGHAFPFNRTPQLANLNGMLFFQADDGVHGRELWKSDGTRVGTEMIEDVYPGMESAGPFGFVELNDEMFFTARDGADNSELWKSDGTPGGTTMVLDIAPVGSSGPSRLTKVNDIIFFRATETGMFANTKLWKTDGTPQGTKLVKDIVPGDGSEPRTLTDVDGVLYFSADSSGIGSAREVWKSDGTAPGTVEVADIRAAESSFPEGFANINGTVFFTANANAFPQQNRELWRTDGTSGGTLMVKDINPGPGNSNLSRLTDVNDRLYFSADPTGMFDNELWKSNGTPTGTTMVADINPGADGSSPSHLTNINGVLYFEARDDVTGRELYRAYVRTDTPPVFDDVPESHPFYNVITNFALSGYTSGCSVTPSLYCPSDPVTRAQMAIFLMRGIAGQDFIPEPAQGNVFNDVPTSAFAAAWIEEFKTRQVTGGCSASPPLYCPNNPITRAQMAVFLLKVIHGSAYAPPPATGTLFTDVNIGDFAADWIEQLAKEGVTGGCSNGDFCPNNPVTRGQMAAFLTRVFHTPLLFK